MRPRRRIAPVVDDGLAELGCACANSRRVARMLTQLYDRHLQGSGIEAPQFALMATLDAHGPCTQTTLGRHHGMDKTTVSRNVGMLRRNGWIARSPALDRRERRIGHRHRRRVLADRRFDEGDEAARMVADVVAQLSAIRGIGRWSAEIYLLFAEGRPDVWPAGDLAVQIEVGRIMGLDGRPTEKQVRTIAAPWSPHRGAAAIFAWHHYKVNGAPL